MPEPRSRSNVSKCHCKQANQNLYKEPSISNVKYQVASARADLLAGSLNYSARTSTPRPKLILIFGEERSSEMTKS